MNRDFPAGEWAIPIDLAREAEFRLGQILVRPSCCEVQLDDPLSIEPRVMQALVALAQRKGVVVSRDELIQRCWNARVVSDDAINRCIAKVRRLAELDSGESFEVETIPRVGYRLTESKQESPTTACLTRDEGITEPHSVAANQLDTARRDSTLYWMLALVGILVVSIAAARLLAPRHQSNMSPPTDSSAPAAVLQSQDNLVAGAIFKDCAVGCPDMVVIPSGYFLMGTGQAESSSGIRVAPDPRNDASPRHEVLIDPAFAMARYDVTREEYARFVRESGRTDSRSCWTLTRAGTFAETIGASWRHPGFVQSSHDPAVCASWEDARAYATWLSRKTSKRYRLPTEAEWEYAARGGSDLTPAIAAVTACRAFNGADADYHTSFPGDRHADLDCHDGFAQTSPVGSFPANAFGLFDMLGNVAQWTFDCYHDSYDGAPVNGSAWTDGLCRERVVRGGYWALDPRSISVSLRGSGGPRDHFSANGFRVARDL